MPTAEMVAVRQEQAIAKIRATIKRHGTREMKTRVKNLETFQPTHSSVRSGVVTPADEFIAALADELADLAELYDGLAEQVKEKGRPGRKPNVQRHNKPEDS